jgi:DNA-binding MarR family transcriptional regulator
MPYGIFLWKTSLYPNYIALRYNRVVTEPVAGRAAGPEASEKELTGAEYGALGDFRYQIRRFLHFSEQAARAEGLEPQQHQMLLAVRACERPSGPTVGFLADHLFIRHHSAVGLLDRLEERGLVERVRASPDRREVHARLTALGEEKLSRLSRVHREELRKSGPVLVDALRELLQHLAPG